MTTKQYFIMFAAICMVPLLDVGMFGYCFFPTAGHEFLLNDTNIVNILEWDTNQPVVVAAFSTGVKLCLSLSKNFKQNFNFIENKI